MRFRSEVILVPLVIILLAVLTQQLKFPATFHELFGLHSDARPLQSLITLGIVLVAIVWAFGKRRDP